MPFGVVQMRRWSIGPPFLFQVRFRIPRGRVEVRLARDRRPSSRERGSSIHDGELFSAKRQVAVPLVDASVETRQTFRRSVAWSQPTIAVRRPAA